MILRLSRAAWPEANRKSGKPPQKATTDEREWDLKAQLQTRGSMHSDCWTGTAATLATSDLVAIYPVTGWWREQPRLGFVEKRARYSLIVTISTDDTEVDLFSAVQDEVAIRAKAVTTIETRI